MSKANIKYTQWSDGTNFVTIWYCQIHSRFDIKDTAGWSSSSDTLTNEMDHDHTHGLTLVV